MPDIYSGSVCIQIKSLCKKRFPSPLTQLAEVTRMLCYTRGAQRAACGPRATGLCGPQMTEGSYHYLWPAMSS